jgi:hypothetical protein
MLLLFALPHHPKNSHDNKNRCTPVLLQPHIQASQIYYLTVLAIHAWLSLLVECPEYVVREIDRGEYFG